MLATLRCMALADSSGIPSGLIPPTVPGPDHHVQASARTHDTTMLFL